MVEDRQLQNLEKTFGGDVRVTLAQMEYELPRLEKMWTNLECQDGGQVKERNKLKLIRPLNWYNLSTLGDPHTKSEAAGSKLKFDYL
ncbi:hypothetical protein ACS0TY_025447 [Phlomoides rotata]